MTVPALTHRRVTTEVGAPAPAPAIGFIPALLLKRMV